MSKRRNPYLAFAGLLLAVLTVYAAYVAYTWVGRPFPGFLLLGNRVIASAGLASWPAVSRGEIYQYEVIEVDGEPLRDAEELLARAATKPIGTPLELELRRGESTLRKTVETRRFGFLDALLLFGSYLLCGLSACGMALVILYLRGRDATAVGAAAGIGIAGAYALTAMDLYGPYRLFRVHALLECLLFAGAFHLALVFPQPTQLVRRRPWTVPLAYGAAGLLALVTQLRLYDPAGYAATHRLAMSAFGLSLVLVVLLQVRAYLQPPSFRARQRVKVLALGTLLALFPAVLLAAVGASSGGQVSENLMGWTGAIFPLAIGYAALRHDLLGVDALLRRTVTYGLLSAVVATCYVGAVVVLQRALPDHSSDIAGLSAVLFGMATAGILLPLRDRLQAHVDRVFFASAYDFRRLVETTSAQLASATDLALILERIEHAVIEALQPAWVSFQVRSGDASRLVSLSGAHVPLEMDLPRRAENEKQPFGLEEGALGVPFRFEGDLNALLLLGPRLSGRYYGGDDRRLLHVLSNQGAVAIENALALERLRVLNRDLERKVEERTGELAHALSELRSTQSQLVHQEKMASLGQLVAGIAHEINNPLNFIQGNLHCLREHGQALVRALGAYDKLVDDGDARRREERERIREECDLDFVVSDLESLLAACDEGVDRTTTLVRDLRTFSRMDGAEVSQLDVHEAINSTLTLLRSRLKCLEIVKCFGEVPVISCIASQVDQVLMNLVANAADAVDGQGTIVLRTQPLDDGRVRIEVEDDGPGISPENAERIFEPFFTTKPVGKGTGLGLAITYGVVQRHGGEIRVRSEPGQGTRFQVDLPVSFTPCETPQGHAEERS